jgi:hypothetical protein
MTRRKLRNWVVVVTCFYVTAILITIWPPSIFQSVKSLKDIQSLILAAPVAWLGYCFQRRHNFVQQLRTVLSKAISAVQNAFQYTHLQPAEATQREFGEVLKNLSCAIDEIRGLYRNIHEKPGERGYYPFESLKTIHAEISALGFTPNFTEERAAAARNNIRDLWKRVREPLMDELDRGLATKTDAALND